MSNKSYPAKIQCTKCGAEFECGANTHDCWCMHLPKVMTVIDDSCWCPKCLEDEINKQKNKPGHI